VNSSLPVFTLILALLAAFPASGEAADNGRLYQSGVDHYAAGDSTAALADFREVLRLEPKNAPALAAVRRLEGEAADLRVIRSPEPARADAFDRFFLVTLPRWFYFERTLGDGLRDLGAMTALNARVTQLIIEKELALAHNRRFRNDRRLRALLRRVPVTVQPQDEV